MTDPGFLKEEVILYYDVSTVSVYHNCCRMGGADTVPIVTFELFSSFLPDGVCCNSDVGNPRCALVPDIWRIFSTGPGILSPRSDGLACTVLRTRVAVQSVCSVICYCDKGRYRVFNALTDVREQLWYFLLYHI